MRAIIVDFERRKRVNVIFFSHILSLSEGTGNIEICVILKSSFYISLYNNVEATIFSLLEKVHDEISRYKYEELTDKLKLKVADYHFGNQKTMNCKKKKELSDLILSGNYSLPQLESYQKFKTVFSGNLNLRKIRDVFSEYGIILGKIRGNPDHLLSVTNKRNKIAHGEQSLSEAGRVSNLCLESVMTSIDLILQDSIGRVDDFLSHKKYLGMPAD